MNKKWLLFLVLILNHTLINSVIAAAHTSGEDLGIYEPRHIHLNFSSVAPSSTDNTPSNPQEHHKTAHVHASCEPCAVPLLIVSQAISLPTDKPTTRQLAYMGLTYKPAVPPPNA